jgi:hypothetical protein
MPVSGLLKAETNRGGYELSEKSNFDYYLKDAHVFPLNFFIKEIQSGLSYAM